MSISESEVQMINQYSQNLDIQDIGLFWQLTIKTIDDLRVVGYENLTLEMYVMQLLHLKGIKTPLVDETSEVATSIEQKEKKEPMVFLLKKGK